MRPEDRGAGLALLAGAFGSLVIERWNPLPPDDPLATTLAALPAVLAALLALGWAAEARGARRLPPWLGQCLAGSTIGWALLLLARPHLGLPFSAPVLAALGSLLLFAYMGCRLLSLRPLLGQQLPQRPSWIFLALPLVAYLALAPWSTGQRPPDGDEPWYLLTTHSLAHDFDAELTDEYREQDWRFFLQRPLEPQAGDPVGPNGELYSRHNALLPLALSPAYRVAGKAGALAMMALLAAALAWWILRLGHHYFPHRPGEALLAYGLAAFAPPLLLYSQQIWVEVPAALLASIGLSAILTARDERQARPPGARPGSLRFWLLLAVLVLLLPLLKIRFMLLAIPLLGLAWWHLGRPWRPMLLLGGGLGILGAGILLFNQVVYDNPLKIHSWQELELHRYGPGDYLEGLVGLFWDSAFGLFFAAPLWLLLIPACFFLLRRRGAARRPSLLFDLTVLVAPYLAIVAPRSEWYGGWSPPFRYALVALPLLALCLVPLLAERRRPGARALIAALGLFTLAFTLLWVAVPGWTYNLADGRTFWMDHLSQRLGVDVARLFPSTVRPRWATWIWPPATLLLLPLLWWLPRGRAGGGRQLVGGVSAVLLLAAVPVLATHLPSRVVELEDPAVFRIGGHLQPDRWVIERTRYRGSWVLREGERAVAPIVQGGDRVAITLEAYFARHHPGPLRLALRPVAAAEGTAGAGGAEPVLLEIQSSGAWASHSIGILSWPRGSESLEIRVLPSGHPGRANGVALDRLVLDWDPSE